MNESEIASTIDIRTYVCPMTWERVKLALERLAPGQELEVLLRGDEPLRNIPRSAQSDGHVILSLEPSGADHRLVIRRGAEGC